MRDSYHTIETGDVQPFRAYKNDFFKSGDFVEEEVEEDGEQIIHLHATLWTGAYNGELWEESVSTDYDSYFIMVYYSNRDHVRVIFDASYGQKEELKKSFEFVKTAAEKFFMVNQYVLYENPSTNRKTERRYDHELTWQEVEKLIADSTRCSTDIRDGQSWEKIMTVDEAKKLFAFLKINIKFPTYKE